jgi:hypothetical protein
MDRIEDLLHGRTDLGSFLVHFTRDTNFQTPANLRRILQGLVIRARTPLGMAAHLDEVSRECL